jgi:DNA-binding CsgD family transcriptional regulator
VTVVVGVDGAGRTHRLDQIAAAADGPVVRVSAPAAADLAEVLGRAATDGALVLVDDAHRLGADELAALAAAARRGVAMVISRRPTIGSPALADLDEAVGGRVEQLGPLDPATLVALTGWTPQGAAGLADASGGLPAIAVGLESSGSPSPSLVARVQRRLAGLPAATAGLARLLAVRLDLDDRTLAVAAGLDPDSLAEAVRSLRDVGFLVPDRETMVPAVAEAILREPAERRRAHDAVARALVETGADVMVAATQLRAARARSPMAADAYRAAGDRIRFDDPAAAIIWYDDALEAGCDAAVLAAGRAEAAALLGLPVDTGSAAPGADTDRLALVEGAVEAHRGRTGRAGEALAAAVPPGPLLAVPSLIATGRWDAARSAAQSSGPPALRRLAEATLHGVTNPASAVPLFIEAAEVAEPAALTLVPPDTPHAVGALVAVVAGDAASAEHLLERALHSGIGGPAAVIRHRLLLAWVRLRIGRYDTAVAECARHEAQRLAGRERLLLAALSAGLARRSGDMARLRDAWAIVEQALARQTVDLFAVEQVEELAVAATRLRRQARVTPLLAALDEVVAGLGAPPAWSVAVGWVRLQLAVAAEDGAAAAAAAAALPAGADLPERQSAQSAAAAEWGRILAGTVDADAVVAVAERLAGAELPWEASRLVGQAAIRTSDPAAARRLLERARELSSAEVVPADGRAESQRGGLSEREVEVARMVLAGGTYREIGGRLFISPKTVEHHVARIRTKLGATTRAEFVAALREVLGEA